MIQWTCDRCHKKHSDNGARVSHIDPSWTTYYLAKVSSNHKEEMEKVIHLCGHCVQIPRAITFEIEST